MRGNPVVLAMEFSKNFSLREAMNAAGYRGAGRIYEAVRDIEEHAHIIRHEIGCGIHDLCDDEQMSRILREYERIAFSAEDEGIRMSDKLKALDVYRSLTEREGTSEAETLVVKYDYGDEAGDDEG